MSLRGKIILITGAAVHVGRAHTLGCLQAGAQVVGKDGSVDNILGWRAFRPGADHLPYTISKSALAALTQAQAPQIQVNSLTLGDILPPTNHNPSQGLLNSLPASRWADLDGVVKTLLFLPDEPSYITGDVIHLESGSHMV